MTNRISKFEDYQTNEELVVGQQGGVGSEGGYGSELVGSIMDNIAAFFGHKGSKSVIVVDELAKKGLIPDDKQTKDLFMSLLAQKLEELPVKKAVLQTVEELKKRGFIEE
jgi:hypothetical protein